MHDATPPPDPEPIATLPLDAPLAAADDFDALADLFLGPDAAQPAQAVLPPRAAVEIDLLVQGHLPVRAGVWPLQYARARAADLSKPVAFVRLMDGQLAVELVDGGAACRPVESPAEALRAARSCSAAVVVQADEANLPALAAGSRPGAITLLVADNDAAIVAAYRTIKSIAPAISAETELRAAIVSRSRRSADEAMARLQDAVALFLDRPLRLAAVIERIVPVRSSCLYRGEFTAGLTRVLTLLTPSGAPAIDFNAPEPARTPPPLASLVPGLRAVEARWPDDPAVEVALDADGAWHVLRSDSDGKGVERLLAAAAWLSKHRALLAAAAGLPRARQGGSMSRPGRTTVLHLFTDAPKTVRCLLDADLRVHLLAPVGDRWCCVELN